MGRLLHAAERTQALPIGASIWQSDAYRWHILYHQGTIVAAEEEDVRP
jgi:hypothetical protein